MNNTDFFLLGDVARILRCQPYQIVYLLTTRQVPEPALRIGNRRVFSIADMQRIAEKLQVQLAQELVDADGDMKHKETMSDDFLSMTELGMLYGVSSHKMGKWLVDLGLRSNNKKPSRMAFENRFVEQRDSTQPGTYFWAWHAEKTMWALDKAGYTRLESPLA